MRNQIKKIYLSPYAREEHKKQIDEFIWPYFHKILPQFSNIENEAEIYANNIFNELMNRSTYDDILDPSDYADKANDEGTIHYLMLKHSLYIITAAWHATLFELFSQQLRRFLYDEISRYLEIEFKFFCDNWGEIKKLIKEFKFNIHSLSTYNKIDELRLLCNVIKHGEGTSENVLKKSA